MCLTTIDSLPQSSSLLRTIMDEILGNRASCAHGLSPVVGVLNHFLLSHECDNK